MSLTLVTPRVRAMWCLASALALAGVQLAGQDSQTIHGTVTGRRAGEVQVEWTGRPDARPQPGDPVIFSTVRSGISISGGEGEVTEVGDAYAWVRVTDGNPIFNIDAAIEATGTAFTPPPGLQRYRFLDQAEIYLPPGLGPESVNDRRVSVNFGEDFFLFVLQWSSRKDLEQLHELDKEESDNFYEAGDVVWTGAVDGRTPCLVIIADTRDIYHGGTETWYRARCANPGDEVYHLMFKIPSPMQASLDREHVFAMIRSLWLAPSDALP